MDHTVAARPSATLASERNDTNELRRRASFRHNRSRRVAWLMQNKHLWRDVLPRRSSANEKSQRRWKEIVMLMRREGLVQPSTHWSDVNLISLIVEARKQLRDRRVSNARPDEIQCLELTAVNDAARTGSETASLERQDFDFAT
jgi:hypothetical protein